MHRVAGLEGRYLGPAQLLELGTGLGRGHELLAVFFLEAAGGQDLDRTGQVVLALRHDHLDAGVLEIGGLVDLHALVGLVDAVFLGHLHGAHDVAAFAVDQCDLVAGLDRFVIGRQGDGDRPEQAVGHLVTVAYAFPVAVGHEAVQRGEAADAHHDEVAGFARGHLDLRQRGGARFFGGECVTRQQQGLEFTATVGAYQFGHAVSSDFLGLFKSGQHSTGSGG